MSAPTTGPSSTNTANTNSITDMTSLPDILRARSAMLVGALELGAPLGRGSYGKVYKGAPLYLECPLCVVMLGTGEPDQG